MLMPLHQSSLHAPILEMSDDEDKKLEIPLNDLKVPPNIPLPTIEVQVNVEFKIEVTTKKVI